MVFIRWRSMGKILMERSRAAFGTFIVVNARGLCPECAGAGLEFLRRGDAFDPFTGRRGNARVVHGCRDGPQSVDARGVQRLLEEEPPGDARFGQILRGLGIQEPPFVSKAGSRDRGTQ